jgi:hypothetical protein
LHVLGLARSVLVRFIPVVIIAMSVGPTASAAPRLELGVDAPVSGAAFADAEQFFLHTTASGAAIADVTGDGRPDVLATSGTTNSPTWDDKFALFPQTPSGHLGTPSVFSTDSTFYAGDLGIATADFSGDGKTDALVALTKVMVSTGATAEIEVADLTSDGRDDIATCESPCFQCLNRLRAGDGRILHPAGLPDRAGQLRGHRPG